METVKTFVLIFMGDNFVEANEARNRDIAEAVSGEAPTTFSEEVLKRISAAMYVTFADRVTFTETLQRHKELLQHMANCYKALFKPN